MDLSKLPRMSDTQKHAPAPPPEGIEEQPIHPVRPGIGAEVWLSLIIGLILMMVSANFARWSIAKLTGQHYSTGVTWREGPKAGQEVEYFELQGYTALTEMGLFIFGLALVLEGAMLAVVYSRLGGKRALTALALFVTVLATGLNLYVSVKLFNAGIIPLMSALAVAFGGYIVMYEWRLLQQLTQLRPSVSNVVQ